MSSYREFVKIEMPKYLSHPHKDRLRLIAIEWKKKKSEAQGGFMSAAGLPDEEGGVISAAGFPDEEGGVISGAKLPKAIPKAKKVMKQKALGGFMKALTIEMPDGVKDSNKLSKTVAKKLVEKISEKHSREFAEELVRKLKDLLDCVKNYV